MANRNRLSSKQVQTVGKYIWENKEKIKYQSKSQSLVDIANSTGIVVARTTFITMIEHMGIEVQAESTSPIKGGLALLERELGVKFSDED